MADVVISYSREDRGLVDQLWEAIEKLGYSVWCDVSTPGGAHWRQVIKTEITQCRALVVLWSPNSEKSVFVPQEVDEAIQLEKPVIALRTRGFDVENIPLGFRHIQALLNTSIPQLKEALERSVPHALVSGTTPSTLPAEVTPQSIFSPAIPSVTLVPRKQSREGQELLKAISGVGRCVRVCGPTKSGKSVLIDEALRERNPIYVPGGLVNTIQAFFDHIAIGLDPAAVSTPSEAFIFAKASQAKRPIVIDDYHRIPLPARKAILKRMQAFLDKDISVILVSWTDIDNDLISADPGLEFRAAPPISLSFWKNTDLAKIGQSGFAALNVKPSAFTLSVVTQHSYSNPFLMQQHCLEVALACGIKRRAEKEISISISEGQAKQIFSSLCTSTRANFLPLIEPRNADRHQLKTGQTATMNGLIALGIRRMQPIHSIGMPALAARIRELVADTTHMNAREIEPHVNGFMESLGKSVHKQTAIEQSSDKLHIHPFFKRYLLWDFAPSKGLGYPDLSNYHDET